MKKGMKIALALLLLLPGGQCKKADEGEPGTLNDARAAFVGASITENWDFGRYFPGRDFRKVIHYDWDKTQAWGEVQALLPRIVVVKECGAYFYTGGGTPLDEFAESVRAMVGLIRGLGAVPVLCTTLPVDVGRGDCTQEQLDDIRSFNEWLRGYCAAEGIVLIDYYGRVADAQGQLPAAFHDGDGLHPNQAGYDALSPLVIPALESAL